MKYYLIRGLLFFIIVICWYFGLALISVPFCIWYLYRYSAYELLVVAVFVDMQFGTQITWPWYSTAMFASALVMEWIRPSLSVYTTGTNL